MYILGGAMVAVTQPVTDANKILVQAWAALSKKTMGPKHPYTFQTDTEAEIPLAWYPFFKDKLGAKRIAAIAPDDETGWAVMDFAKFVSEKVGVEHIPMLFTRSATMDFTPMLTKLLAKKPDVIESTSATPPGQWLAMVKQLRGLGYKGYLLAGAGSPMGQALEIAGKDAIEGMYVRGQEYSLYNAKAKDMRARYTAKYGAKDWNFLVVDQRDNLYWLTQAIEEAQSLDVAKVAAQIPKMKLKDAWLEGTYFGGKAYYGSASVYLMPHVNYIIKDGKQIGQPTLQVPEDLKKLLD